LPQALGTFGSRASISASSLSSKLKVGANKAGRTIRLDGPADFSFHACQPRNPSVTLRAPTTVSAGVFSPQIPTLVPGVVALFGLWLWGLDTMPGVARNRPHRAVGRCHSWGLCRPARPGW